jgi:hypothetical protein
MLPELIDAAFEQDAQLGAKRRGCRGLRPLVSGLFGAGGVVFALERHDHSSRFWRRSRISD